MKFTIETEREEDGRWIAEVLELPGVLTYSTTEQEAISKAKALDLRVIADRVEHGETRQGKKLNNEKMDFADDE